MPDYSLTSWLIEFQIARTQTSFQLRLDDALTFGRSSPKSDYVPDVDLAEYNAEELGVSRRHLTINAEDDNLQVIDLESGNGTSLNGSRLEPNRAYPLKHLDLLRLGQLELVTKIILSPSHSSTTDQQQSVQVHDQTAPGEGQLILIVEDDPAVAKLLALMLKRAGYTTAHSHDVVGAMRLFKQRKPAAVLLDLMLPDMNGLELAKYIRRDTEQNTTPVIIISAAKTQENIDAANKAGANIFLGKPLSMQELRHVVGSVILHNTTGSTLNTKRLVGTAPLRAVPPESRQDSAVLFIAGYDDAPLTIRLKQPVSFGRKANVSDQFHIDLSRYEAMEMGVSRVHALLSSKDGAFFVKDLESVNGTFVNGEPIKANAMIPLSNADEIRLGQLRMYIYFLTDTERAAMEREDVENS